MGRQQRLRRKGVMGISDEEPSNRHGRQAGVIPHGGLGIDFHGAAAIPTRDRYGLPRGIWVVQMVLEGG